MAGLFSGLVIEVVKRKSRGKPNHPSFKHNVAKLICSGARPKTAIQACSPYYGTTTDHVLPSMYARFGHVLGMTFFTWAQVLDTARNQTWGSRG